MQLVITSEETLKSLITDAIATAIGSIPQSSGNTATADYLTEKQACDYLAGCSKHTLYKLVREGKIEKIQLGERRTAYSRVQLAEYLSSVTTKK